jgi:hypothetical protein
MQIKLTKDMDKQEALSVLNQLKNSEKNNIKSFFGKGSIKGDLVKIQQKLRADEWDF